jgi:uroporphyrinogen III methyltransferase/synthase
MGRVFIIGAGPGDPGLITARGIRLLAEADVVVYDRGVEPVLRWARPTAERIAAGAPAERDMAQDAISMLLAEKARDGHTVARLKWGDPFVFDSGAKEALFLHEQGIPFEVVPGVPVAIGASAYAGIPVTYPGAGDALVLVRGQEDAAGDIPALDWPALAAVDGTLACFAGGRLIPGILRKLLDNGLAPEGAAALIYQGTEPAQRTVVGTIQSLHEATSGDTASGNALLIIGRVIGLRQHLRWFDERPLFGKRIVVTRSSEQAPELVDALEALGAETLLAPTFHIVPPDDPEALDRAAASVDEYDWLVLQSASTATRFLAALTQGPRDLRALGRVRLCAIGASTADRLAAAGIRADVVVPEAGPDRIADAMIGDGPVSGTRVLVVRPDHVRGTLAADLERLGASVTDLIAYRTAPASPDSPGAQDLYRRLLEGTIDAVTFTSPTALRRFAVLIGTEQAADLLNTTTVATIGPVTAAAAVEMGINAPLVARRYTVDGLVEALVEHHRAAAISAR